MARIYEDGVSIGPADGFTLGSDSDGYPSVVIEQRAFTDERPVHIVFGEGPDAESRARELGAALIALANRLEVSR